MTFASKEEAVAALGEMAVQMVLLRKELAIAQNNAANAKRDADCRLDGAKAQVSTLTAFLKDLLCRYGEVFDGKVREVLADIESAEPRFTNPIDELREALGLECVQPDACKSACRCCQRRWGRLEARQNGLSTEALPSPVEQVRLLTAQLKATQDDRDACKREASINAEDRRAAFNERNTVQARLNAAEDRLNHLTIYATDVAAKNVRLNEKLEAGAKRRQELQNLLSNTSSNRDNLVIQLKAEAAAADRLEVALKNLLNHLEAFAIREPHNVGAMKEQARAVLNDHQKKKRKKGESVQLEVEAVIIRDLENSLAKSKKQTEEAREEVRKLQKAFSYYAEAFTQEAVRADMILEKEST